MINQRTFRELSNKPDVVVVDIRPRELAQQVPINATKAKVISIPINVFSKILTQVTDHKTKIVVVGQNRDDIAIAVQYLENFGYTKYDTILSEEVFKERKVRYNNSSRVKTHKRHSSRNNTPTIVYKRRKRGS